MKRGLGSTPRSGAASCRCRCRRLINLLVRFKGGRPPWVSGASVLFYFSRGASGSGDWRFLLPGDLKYFAPCKHPTKTPKQSMNIFFSVGEPSGDLHGANLIRELRSQGGEKIRCLGYGGPRMADEGCELHEDLTQHAVMGFIQVFWKLPQFFALARRAKRYFREHQPDAVVLIDFPGFNWHIARHAKREGIPVFYYGTPQLWGWASWRVSKLRRWVDHALCKLSFEEPWLRARGCNATHVGHPYFDELRERQLDTRFIDNLREPTGPLVTLLPGSRTQEVRANFRWQLSSAKKITQSVPNVRFAVAAFKKKHAQMVEETIRRAGAAAPEKIEVFTGRTPELIEAAECCLAVSGSVSLELLYHTKPTAILYHVSPFAFWLQSIFRRVRYITLVNLLTTDELFPAQVGQYQEGNPADAHVLMPEYLTWQDCSDSLAKHAVEWLTDDRARESLIDRMRELREGVGQGGASKRAAEYMLEALDASIGRSEAA